MNHVNELFNHLLQFANLTTTAIDKLDDRIKTLEKALLMSLGKSEAEADRILGVKNESKAS